MLSTFLTLFLLHLVTGINGDCSTKCHEKTRDILTEETRNTSIQAVMDACSFGCRMAGIDKILTWPLPSNSSRCTQSCAVGYSCSSEATRSCVVGCNLVTTGDAPFDILSHEMGRATETPVANDNTSVVDYFISFTISLFGGNNGGKEEENDEVEIQDATTDNYLYIFIYNDTPEPSYEDTPTIVDSAHQCLWTALQFLCLVMLLVSFVLCFCMLFTNEGAEPKENVQYKKLKPVFQLLSHPVDMYTVPVKRALKSKIWSFN